MVLTISETKKKYNYKEIIEKIKNDKTKSLIPNNVLEIIKLDVRRTSFKNNIEENKELLSNILKGIAFIKTKLYY